MGFWLIAALVFTVILSVISFVLRPKPKRAQPREFDELEDPTAGEGAHIRVIFGRMRVRPHVMWFGEKSTYTYTIEE